MPRDIMTDQSQKTELSAAVSAVREPAREMLTSKPDQQDALAGSLPVWDLVPQNQFIRRIK